jgi:molybdenum cofactor cytidylyltransferase
MITAVVLAAGSSRRMGSNKLALPWGKSTMLESTLQALATPRISRRILVLGHEAERWQHLAKQGWEIVQSPLYAQGQSYSLRAGIHDLGSECESILFCLGDLPLLQQATVDYLIEVFQQNKLLLAAPSYQGKRGNPVLFASSLLPELRELSGDVGARIFFQRYPHILVPVEDYGTITDIDTPEEYAKWREKQGC